MVLEKERKNIAYFMRRLYEQKLTTTSGGNISRRIDDIVLITASQTDKARMSARQVGTITMDGKNLSDNLKISIESKMHLTIYSKRPDVKAIVHAHPVFATSFGIAGKEIKTNLSGETRAVLGTPAIATYALMGTQDLADRVANACLNGNVILMENHGVLTVGENLLQAYDRMEVLENCAKMTLITELLGNRKELSIAELKAIDQLFE
jgi:L-fuculose-phosphate aldolase